MFPVTLNLQGRRCLLVGAGQVGKRRLTHLLASGAFVRVVCLERSDQPLPEQVEWRVEAYRPEHLDAMALALAAAPPAVNQAVVRDARARGIWVNAADAPEASDFLIPAVLQRGSLQVAISTGGMAPALAGVLRRQLETVLPLALADWVALLGELRARVHASTLTADQQRGLLTRWSEWHWLDAFEQQGSEAVRNTFLAELAALEAGLHQ